MIRSLGFGYLLLKLYNLLFIFITSTLYFFRIKHWALKINLLTHYAKGTKLIKLNTFINFIIFQYRSNYRLLFQRSLTVLFLYWFINFQSSKMVLLLFKESFTAILLLLFIFLRELKDFHLVSFMLILSLFKLFTIKRCLLILISLTTTFKISFDFFTLITKMFHFIRYLI